MPTIAEKYGLVKPQQTIAEKYGLTREPVVREGGLGQVSPTKTFSPTPTTPPQTIAQKYGLLKSAETTQPLLVQNDRSLPVRALETVGDIATSVAFGVPHGIALGSLALQDLVGTGLEKGFGVDVSEQRAKAAKARRIMERKAPTPESGLGELTAGAARFVGAAAGPGGLARAGTQVGLKALGKVGEKKLTQRLALGPQAAATFAGGTGVLDTDALVSGELTTGQFMENMGYSGLTGLVMGLIGGVPAASLTGRAARVAGEVGSLAGVEPAAREGRLPTKDELIYSGIVVGMFKSVGLATQRRAEKTGQTVEQVKADELEKYKQTGKLSPELQAEVDRIGRQRADIARQPLQKGADIGITRAPQEAQKAEEIRAVKLFRKGRPEGAYWSESPRYVDEGFPGIRPRQEAILPANTKLLDARNYSNFNKLLTAEEAEILGSMSTEANISVAIQKKVLARNGYDGMMFLDEGKGSIIYKSYFLVRPPSNIKTVKFFGLQQTLPPTPSTPERIAPPDVTKARVEGEVAKRASKALREGDTKTYQEEMDKLSASDQIGVHISTEALPQERIGVKERAESVYTAIKDRFRPIQRFAQDVSGDKPLKIDEDPFLLHRLSVGWRGKPETFIERGTFSFKEGPGKLSGKGLIDIWRPIKDKRSEYSKYILAKATEGRERAEKTTGIRPDLSVEERINLSKQAIAELEAQHPEFAKVFEEQKEWQDAVVRYATEAELIAPETAALWKKMYENYTPMHRVMETPGIDLLSKGHGDVFQPFKRAKGSERLIIDPMETTIKNVYSIMAAAERNANALSVVNLAGRPNGERWVKRVKTPLRPVAQLDLKEIAQKLKVSVEELQELGVTKDLVTIFRPDAFVPKGKNIVQVRRKGKVELYELEPTLFRAMSTIDAPSMGAVGKIMSFPTKLLRAGAVLSPDFIFGRNPVRDQGTAFLFSKYNFIPGVDLARGLFHYLGATDTYFRWKASGGPHSTLVALDRNYLQHNLKDMYASRISQIPKVFTHPIEALRALSEALETGTRLGEFALGEKAEGLSKAGLQKGAFASKEVTLDFSRVGVTGRSLNNMIAFWNAQLEGIDKLAREFRARPSALTVKMLAGITLPSVLLWFVNRDDEEIQNLATWRKDLFWNFRIGSLVVSLPKPFEPGILFGTTAEKMLDWMLENDPDAIKKAGDAILRGATPDIIPTAFRPFVEQVANRNLFFDRPIVPRGKEKLEPFLQSTSYSSRVSKLIGETLNISPARIDAFIRGTTGGLGRLGVSGIDIGLGIAGVGVEEPSRPAGGLSDIPIIRAYIVRNPSSQTSSMEDFYDKFNRAVTVRATLRKLIAEGRVEETRQYSKKNKDSIVNYSVLNGINTQLRQHRKIIQRVMQSKLTPQQKRERLDKVMSQMGHLTFTLMKKLRERR